MIIKRKLNKIDLVILAGGIGSRISKFTKKQPKPLINFNNRNFITYLINYYAKYPFNRIFILAGYKGKQISAKFHKKISNGIRIDRILEKKVLGTGGALSQLKHKTNNNLVIINGDSFIKTDLKFLFENNIGKKNNYIFLTENKNYKSNKLLSNLSLNKKGDVNFSGKLMNAGIYYFKNHILKRIPNKKISLENEIINNLIKTKNIKGKKILSDFIDIGTYSNLIKGKKEFHKQFIKPAVFLDRDGVINYDLGYVHNMKKFRLRKNVIKGIKYLNLNDYYVFIVTNQSGIARGIYTEETYLKFYRAIKEYFFKKQCYINDMEYSPFLKGSKIKKYNKNSKLRKPGNLMILNLFKKWVINKNKSFMLGDQIKDMISAKKSNLYFEYAKEDFNLQIRKILRKFNNY